MELKDDHVVEGGELSPCSRSKKFHFVPKGLSLKKNSDVLEKKTCPQGRDDSHVVEVDDFIIGSLFHS